MSVTVSIFCRSPRTEAAQPPHVMLGTVSVTNTRFEDESVAEPAVEGAAVGAEDS